MIPINISRGIFSGFSLLIAVCIVFLSSCINHPQPEKSGGNIRVMDDTLLNYNKDIAKTEDQEIDDFILRYGWKMEKSGTGLRYMIYKRGNGPKTREKMTAVIKYEVRLINGNLIYSSEREGLKEFVIGHGGLESGIEEGILLMRVGDRAKFILPSHLAFGLLGDQKKIPQRASLVYDIELINLK